jgi:hypothetical protein
MGPHRDSTVLPRHLKAKKRPVAHGHRAGMSIRNRGAIHASVDAASNAYGNIGMLVLHVRFLSLIDFRQYNVFGQPQGKCGWYNR